MELVVSLPWSQKLNFCPYPKSEQFRPFHKSYSFNTHFNITVPPTIMYSMLYPSLGFPNISCEYYFEFTKFSPFHVPTRESTIYVLHTDITFITKSLAITWSSARQIINPLNAELNPICYLLALLGAHHFLHVSRIRVKLLTVRRLMSYIYIYGAPILDVSRSHTTTHHSR